MALRVDLDEAKLATFYHQGLSVLEISARLGVSRPPIYRILKKLGLPARSAREANLLRMSRLSAEERLQLSSAAHDAVRGAKRSSEDLIRRALGKEQNATVSAGERGVLDRLASLGVHTRPSLAVHIFNLDLGYIPGRVGVEIHGTFHTTERKARQDAKKLEYMMANGWFMTYLHLGHITDEAILTVANICKDRAARLLGQTCLCSP